MTESSLSEFRIATCNVGRRMASHDALLSICAEVHIDILLVQEPWIFSDLSLRRSRAHPCYRSFLPPGPWSRRPRVCTYILNAAAPCCTQLQAPRAASLDILPIFCRLPSRSFALWNIYNAPSGEGVIDPRAASQALQHHSTFADLTVLFGDFNFPQAPWISPANSDSLSSEFADYTAQQNLSPLVPPHPTHDAGNILDLAFISQPLLDLPCYLQRLPSLDVDSDHRTLCLAIPLDVRIPPRPPALALHTIQEDQFHKSLTLALREPSRRLETASDVDCEAEFLTHCLASAAAQSCKPRRFCHRALPFWTPECKQLNAELRAARNALRRAPPGPIRDRTDEWVIAARRDFRKAFQTARRQHYDTTISNLADVGSVARFTRWRKVPFAAAMPPLTDPSTGQPVEQTSDKHQLFHTAFTNPGFSAEDLPDPPQPVTPLCPPIDFPLLTPAEVRQSCIGVSSTTPGQDGIPVSLLKLAWPHIADRVLALFQACLLLGHHPRQFHSARVVIIPKPGDRDRTLPRSYRPISLLSALGKGLERVVAKRFAHQALAHSIVGPRQCGALPRRSAVDLTSALTHDVELAWGQRKVCSLLTLDIQGAFDAVFPRRLRKRLLEQGWPIHIVDWVYSFCSN